MGMGLGGLFLSWRLPSPEQQKSCLATAGSFNYDLSFHSSSSSSSSQHPEIEKTLTKNGFFINRSRVHLGSGPITFNLAKSALLSWAHFNLGWAFVDPTTPVEKGTKFCVCVKELVPWLLMPLQIAYVSNSSKNHNPGSGGIKASFAFAGGTLQGHLLAGEERFSVEMDESDRVWYEIFSFSKPAHLLSVLGYPYVQLRQRTFAQQSANALLKHITAQKSAE